MAVSATGRVIIRPLPMRAPSGADAIFYSYVPCVGDASAGTITISHYLYGIREQMVFWRLINWSLVMNNAASYVGYFNIATKLLQGAAATEINLFKLFNSTTGGAAVALNILSTDWDIIGKWMLLHENPATTITLSSIWNDNVDTKTYQSHIVGELHYAAASRFVSKVP